jgi:hypothetical protein
MRVAFSALPDHIGPAQVQSGHLTCQTEARHFVENSHTKFYT